MRAAAIADVCSLVTDGTHYTPPAAPSGVPFLTVKDMRDGSLDFASAARISPEEFARTRAGNSAPLPGDVLFSKDGTVGKVHIVGHEGDFAVLSSIAILRPDQDLLDSRYLGHALRSPGFLRRALRAQTGTAIRRVILSDLQRVVLPLPSLEKQRRVARVLDLVDQLRMARMTTIARSEALLRSLFDDMFAGGERVVRNPIGEVIDVGTGRTPDRARDDYFGGDIPWVKTTEVRGEVISSTEESLTPDGARAAGCAVFPSGSIVIAMYGQGRTRGRCAMLGIDAATNQACAVLAPSDRYDSRFMFEQLKLSYDRLRDAARGGNQPNLNLGLIRSFPVLLPNLADQRGFSVRAEKVDRLIVRQRSHLAHLTTLSASLVHRAFTGVP